MDKQQLSEAQPRPTVARSIAAFLAQNRFAFVGVSKEERSYSRRLFRAFLEQGFSVVPVNPTTAEIDGIICRARLADITPPVTQALVLVPAAARETVLADCQRLGVTRVWLPMTGKRDNLETLAALRARGVEVIAGGFCPLMFLDKSGAFHHFHGWIARQSRDYKTAPVV